MCKNLSGNTAENDKNTLSKFHRDLSPFAEEFVKVCRYKTFWIRISARRTFLLFRCYSIHVKLCVLKVEIEFKRVRAHAAACTAVSPMSGSPTSGTLKKTERGEFITPPGPTGRRSNEWLIANKLTLNSPKTEFMLIGSRAKAKHISNCSLS